MAIKVAISHITQYKFDRLVSLSPHVLRLRPAPHTRTPIEGYSLKILPEKHFINWQQDPFGNYQARVVFPEKTDELLISVEVIARMEVINPFDFFVEEYAENYPFEYDAQTKLELTPYLEIIVDDPSLKEWIEKRGPKGTMRIVDFLVEINRNLNADVRYNIRMEAGVQSPQQTLAMLSGSCRDSAWLLVQILRNYGLAARFVSGYLVQLKSDVKSLDGPSGPEEDFTDLHAWAEVYIPGAGWIGLDPTSGLLAGEGHIPLSATPHYQSAAPVTGSIDPSKVTLTFENKVFRIMEDPRVTKPYSDKQWSGIMEVGQKVDDDLLEGDVRLTMGGEPTFVSIDDQEAAEWNTVADGKHKRQLAYDFALRLRQRFAKGGLLHFGLGKWYPGEPFPRWQYAIHWRKDGSPIWKNNALLGSPDQPPQNNEAAEKLLREIASLLGVGSEPIQAAYEDPIYWALEEGKLPANLDPLNLNLEEKLVRRALGAQIERGLKEPAGFLLPLKWGSEENRWITSTWLFRREHCFLIPGDVPIGLRLPLESLPKVNEGDEETPVSRSGFDALPPLAEPGTALKARKAEKKTCPPSEDLVIRQAISTEVRDGIIYVFLPPVDYLENYLDLVETIEAAAEYLSTPVRLEGYAPPIDIRATKIAVSPDPGVIEVNVQPAASWNEIVQNTTAIYEEAHHSRLATEKFMVDGRLSGSGGGNHVTIGGPTPKDSPVLRRPDLLRSLITYWQHHPVLSYLFAGPFIGPTSQAPRVDEGRDDRLYELEIAFNQIPDNEEVPFWVTDRLFRNLLVDITGNTHRAEFCIDKLYAPGSESGRLGIVEFRAFDMPPHKQMNLVQVLLVRSLIAWFWKAPYKKKLIRWGTELHDKFLLPQYAYFDMLDVVEDLKSAGYNFDISWFDPFFEFRFPRYGTISVGSGIELEIRLGIEPWHVLGEELSNTGTARFVDSSLERLQVKLSGIVEDRHILACNGCRVPMWKTGIQGEYVSGVRYKAWNPPTSLHPTVGVDAPLVFDVIDTWNNRTIGGCTYFVSHPGGRSYESYPVNSHEAEARRTSRFWGFGHSPAQSEITPTLDKGRTSVSRFIAEHKTALRYDTPIEIINPEFPHTLDLRRFWGTRGKN